MMTKSEQEGNSSGVQTTLNLQEFVKLATWRELLVELVEKSEINPWDIDIEKRAEEYINAIKKMQLSDLHIPANMVLAASILLRMKSESIVMFNQEEEAVEDMQQSLRSRPDVEDLIPRIRMQPKRKITFNELMSALGDALKAGERREMRAIENNKPLDIVIDRDDIDAKIKEAYNLVVKSSDKEGISIYGELEKYYGSRQEAIFSLFVPLLFLANKGDVDLIQEEFFNQIFIKITPNGASADFKQGD